MSQLLRHQVSVSGQDSITVLGLAMGVDGLGFEPRKGTHQYLT
jgi:hypothetical protein